MNYADFLRGKLEAVRPAGFRIQQDDLPRKVFRWQRALIVWALRLGRAAVFLDCGMGKTPIQLHWAYRVSLHTGKPVLILAPLAVAAQTQREGVKFGVRVTVCRSQDDVRPGVNVANYEMLDHFDASAFGGVVLDESSILKSYMGKTKRALVEAFRDTPFRLCCTATPAPNDLMELLNHAEYLGVMRSSEALSVWFIADQTNSGVYRLKRHAESDFWRWVSSWAVCADRPSDLGYSDAGYELPGLHVHDEVLPVSEISDGFQDGLLRKIDRSATGYHREKRVTLAPRAEKCAEIARRADGPVLIWCHLNEESAALKALLPEALEVRGSDSPEAKERAALAFIDGRARVLISKPSIFGFGLNFQHCHTAIFCGLDHSYEGYYQAVRRLYRFGQTQDVHIWRVIGSTERDILENINGKAEMREGMRASMADAMRSFQTGNLAGRAFTLDLTPQQAGIPDWLRSEAI